MHERIAIMISKSEQKKVSVQIVTFNSAEHIINCLQAIFTQTYPIAQVIIVDNASTDATRSLLELYAQQALFLFNDHNVGFAPAHNLALTHSIGDFCLVLNPDVILHNEYVANLVEYMMSDNQIGSTTGKLLLKSSANLIDSTGLVIKKSRRVFDREAGEIDHQPENLHPRNVLNNDPIEIFGVSGAAAMYSKNMIFDVTLSGQFFDEAFFAYKEDTDVAWRAQLYGWTSFYVPKAVAFHERGWKSGSRNEQPLFIRRYSYINRYRMILKNDQLSFFIRHIYYIMPFELVSFAYVLFREPALLKSWVTLYRDLPHIIRQRKEISNRKVPNARRIYRFFN
jgi:GT2 family glycosyltransferase